MYTRNLLSVLPFITSSHALKLIISSYGPQPYGSPGTISTLVHTNGTSSLEVTQKNQDCGSQSSWLEVSPDKTKVLCVDEFNPTGSITMLSLDSEGKLTKLSNASTLGGPVSSAFFGKDDSSIALAHIANASVPARQDTAHVHQAPPRPLWPIRPSSRILGADLVRIYGVGLANKSLTEQPPLKAKAGYGPRHAVFWQPDGKPWDTKLFLLHELSNKIVSYNVTYPECGGLEFAEVGEFSMFGDKEPPAGAGAAEILTSPDNKFIIASNRLAPMFTVPNADPKNETKIQSDSIITFKPLESGQLEFVEIVASGGMKPRHFNLNTKGDKIAVANGLSENVVVYQRDVETGKIGSDPIASGFGLGDVTNVRFLDE
ncbi:hypothetical protein SNOG_00361 [Parastagonospora nodorum SN15]|uniref:6-phosphogluconolactonase n=1 Tax=Phaeosphaeria nodorum (strain SN15 / ATCC MYA-4574 / FGSC 10173) TaxID=321614 RepID=Q0V6K3_PHANO|nr:hypothetical protein SNOG_00361 [Parastagonospora nodorum SN15]EAT91856.2 hypothetical protein SNOG_00361 [Parastagonospora nodorum SN15]